MNPFAGYGAIVTGSRFVGRTSELGLLTERLSAYSGSISIIGEPRVGKSSLANAAVQSVRASNVKLPIAWLDVSTLPGSRELFEAILSEIVSECQNCGVEVPSGIAESSIGSVTSGYEAYRRCRLGLLALKRAGVHQILVLDEFDSVRRFDDAATTIQRIRDLIYRRFETGLVAVFISRRSLHHIEQQVADVSTLDNVCEQFCVRPFERVGLEEMLGRCKEEWDPSSEDRALLWWYSGGHPYLAEMILCCSYASRSIADGAKGVGASIYEFYEHLRRLLQEDDLFEQLLQVVVGPRWSVRTGSLEILQRYGLVRSAQVEAGQQYSGWSEHFQLFLERSAREASIWALWRETECAIRDLIREKISRAYGDEWISALKVRHPNVAEAVSSCERRLAQERKVFGVAAVGGVLDYSYPMDLWSIIACEWDLFRGLLLHDKRYWADRFTHLAKVRTPTAHNREVVVPDHEIDLAQAHCKEILAVIREDRTRTLSTSAPER